jgi:hypothetical protein
VDPTTYSGKPTNDNNNNNKDVQGKARKRGKTTSVTLMVFLRKKKGVAGLLRFSSSSVRLICLLVIAIINFIIALPPPLQIQTMTLLCKMMTFAVIAPPCHLLLRRVFY